MRTSLHGIAQAAQAHRRKRFRGLYGCFNRVLLEQAFRDLNKKAVPGVDGVAYHEYEQNLERNLADLEERLKTKRYRARLVRRTFIAKANGGQRPLGIPALEDKIVQNLARRILEILFEPLFLDCSYAYRPHRSARMAAEKVQEELRGRYSWVVEADIKSFFDTIDHERLIEMIKTRVDDEAFIRLIRKWLKAGVLTPRGEVERPTEGTPQGGLVSPVLANIYLHFALDKWFEEEVKKKAKGETVLIRYADDFVAAFRYHGEAARYQRELKKRLEEFGLAVAEEKTRKLMFNRFRKDESETFDFLGFEFRHIVSRKGHDTVWMRTSPRRQRRIVKAFALWLRKNLSKRSVWLLGMVKTKLKGLREYFGVRGNSAAVRRMHDLFYRTCFRLFNRRSQRKSMTWPQFGRMWNAYNVSSLRRLCDSGQQMTLLPCLR
jgi:group II intron reverse transcriptase/maturase